MTLSAEELKKIAQEYVKEDFPELADVAPTVQEEERAVSREVEAKLGLGQPKAIPAKVRVFTFKKTVKAEDGANIPIVSRITMDENGNIIKATGN
ncbi:MAG: hypothetical protein GY737_21820 [Desulfobacteraceae bacterium]|nr:hypothetical protein [Desulfobacteraceae bacterium]